MNAAIRNIQLVAVVIVLLSTIVAFLLEIIKMYETQTVTLADLLLMFIYIEVIGLIKFSIFDLLNVLFSSKETFFMEYALFLVLLDKIVMLPLYNPKRTSPATCFLFLSIIF